MVTRKTAKVAEKPAAKNLRDYELTLVVSPELTEEKFKANVENVNKFITGKGGVIGDVQWWGKKRLAYPIKHFIDGYYVLVRFKSEATLNRELEASLEISEEVIRYLLVRMD